ncbi:MAG TPA: hypothetical protein VNZ22_10305, partial [Bacillota bacterium]|nr:hypothetical protein [Bacillota bacterium]
MARAITALACACLGPLAAGAQPIAPKASSLSSFVHPDTAPAGSWQAQWIGVAQPSSSNQWVCFRKSFDLQRIPAKAVARVAADSKYWLWVNGRLVVREGGLKRGPTPSDTYFDEVDLAPHLRRGANHVAVLVWFFGKEGFSHHSSGQSGLLFQLEADGLRVVSDASWQTRVHPAFENTGAPYP